MNLRFGPQAVSDIRAARAWWSANRPSAPTLLDEELNHARTVLRATPHAGAPSRDAAREDIRRLLLQRTRYFLYYAVDEQAGAVDVLRLWHVSRGSAPAV